MSTTIYASFSTPEMAEKALGALLDHGCLARDIGLAFSEKHAPLYSETAVTPNDIRDHADSGITTTTSQDATAGAAKGAGVGLGLGALAAIASLAIPGFGLVVGGGALAIALGGVVGATAAGAVAGGTLGFLKDQGIPDTTISSYSKVIGEGGAIMSVTTPTNGVNEYTVEALLVKYGAGDIHHLTAMPTTAVVNDVEAPVAARQL